jgi:hypothetical protein
MEVTVQLSRKRGAEYAELPQVQRQAISKNIEYIFKMLTLNALDLNMSEQQVLLMELSQLGLVFTTAEWRENCPLVPMGLLNSLMDCLMNNLRKLRGDQIGVFMASLDKLHLRDRAAFQRICDVIEDQLDSPGKNSWYLRTEPLAALVYGVVSVFTVSSRH